MERVADRDLSETVARFWSFVDRTETCWNWTRAIRCGYGRFKIRGRYFSAHRLSWEYEHGPIPDGLTIDHVICRNRRCVNPEHLELVTLGENTARSNRRRGQVFRGEVAA